MAVAVEIVNEQARLRLNQAKIRRLIDAVLRGEKAKRRQLTLLVCDDRRIRILNKRYFKKDRATDVIAFGSPKTTLAMEKHYLGDIVVSAQTAVRVSGDYQTTPQRELERYVVHGVLHLLGYDDRYPKAYRRMHARQEQYLKRFHQTNARRSRKAKA